MARYDHSVSTLQARTIVETIEKDARDMSTRFLIEDTAFDIVHNLEREFPAQFPMEDEKSLLAFTFSACAKFAIKTGDLHILEYIRMLAEIKEDNETALHDFGAFGDLYEILIRCAFVRKKALLKWSMLSVKQINAVDIVSRKYGKIEVGHNGKTLTFGTMNDFMKGDYDSFVYGVFSEEDKKAIYNLCKNYEYDKAIDYVTSYSVYWASKYQFQKDMDNLTRGQGITAKKCGIQIVYNPSKYNAFVNAIENGIFESLNETLKK